MITLYKWLVRLFMKKDYESQQERTVKKLIKAMHDRVVFYNRYNKEKYLIIGIDYDCHYDVCFIDVRRVYSFALTGCMHLDDFERDYKPVIRLKANLKE